MSNRHRLDRYNVPSKIQQPALNAESVEESVEVQSFTVNIAEITSGI